VVSGADSFSRQTDCAEGFADLRAAVGARSEVVVEGTEAVEQEPPIAVATIDVRGKPVITIYVAVGAAGAITVHCNWGVAGSWWTDTFAAPAGVTTIVDFLRAADYLNVLIEADADTVSADVALEATHG